MVFFHRRCARRVCAHRGVHDVPFHGPTVRSRRETWRNTRPSSGLASSLLVSSLLFHSILFFVPVVFILYDVHPRPSFRLVEHLISEQPSHHKKDRRMYDSCIGGHSRGSGWPVGA